MQDEGVLNDSDQIREMYALYGLAMYFAQAFETAVRLALVLAKLSNSPTASKKDYDNLLSSSSNSVLGRLMGSLKPFLTGDASLEADLEAALHKRHYLVHHFFWDHAIGAMTTAGRYLMIEEAVSAKELFENVTVRLDNVARSYVVARGMSIAQHEIAVERELRALQLQAADKSANETTGKKKT